MSSEDSKRDSVLLRMLRTPPQKRAPKVKRAAEELIREIDKGAGADLGKIARDDSNNWSNLSRDNCIFDTLLA